MSKFCLSLLIFFIFSKGSNVKKYNVEKVLNIITINLKDTTACVCIKLDDFKNYKNFHIKIFCNDNNAKIDKTLYYNYIDSCDSKTTCDDKYLNNYLENNNRTIEIESITGFVHEYKFNKSNARNAILVQYKNFTGESFTLQSTALNSRITYMIALGIMLTGVVIGNIIIIIFLSKKNNLI